MEVTIETSGPSLAKVSFVVPGDEFRKEFRSGLKQVGSRVRMKGFRPGKVPPHVLEKQFGDQVRLDVMETFLRRAYQQAVEERELKPLSHPRVPREEMSLREDGSFGLDFEVSLRPEFELPDYKGLRIESELEPVMETQIEQVVEDLRRQESVPEPAGEEGIDENGVVVCDVRFVHGEEVVFEREGLRMAAHTPPPGVDPQRFGEVLLGAAEGASLELEMVLPPNIENEAAAGQPGMCRLEVREAFRMVPPSDEEMFAKLEVEDDAGLKKKIRGRLEEVAHQREESRLEAALLDQVIAGAALELPGPLLEEQAEHRLTQLAQQMRENGVEEDKIDEQLDEQRATAREEAEKSMRALLLVEAIGERESLLVTNEELEEELVSIAARNEATVEEVRDYYAKNNLGQQMAVEVLERKVRRFLRENAQIEQPA